MAKAIALQQLQICRHMMMSIQARPQAYIGLLNTNYLSFYDSQQSALQ